MRIIKLYEDFTQDVARKLQQDINDVLVELSDDGFEFEVHIVKMNIEKEVTYFHEVTIDIFKKLSENGIKIDDFQVSQIYETVMTLIGFMRDKYNNLEISYYLSCDDDYDYETIEEFLADNDFESIEDISETPLSVIDIYNFTIKFNNNEV